ncbi:MAG: LLM class flavin-dependent oxidoreductase [Microlunatus sp.]|nr:LLM class flavin-dependent oxidoreductase [Microlunatus sp.]
MAGHAGADLDRIAPGRRGPRLSDRLPALGRPDGEALAVIRHLFEGGAAPYDGRLFCYQQGVFGPLPSTPVPIMIGGNSDAALRRTARYGDAWQAPPMPPEVFARRIADLARLADRTVPAGIRIQWDDGRPAARVAAEVAAYHDAGAAHVAVHFGGADGYADRITALAGSVDWDRLVRHW